ISSRAHPYRLRAQAAARTLMIEPPEAVFNRGLSLLGARRASEALACFDQILVMYPDVVEVLSARAIALAELGRFSEALTTYDRAAAIRPDYVDAHYNRALVLERLGRIEEALRAWTGPSHSRRHISTP
ncbi:MAG TPA: tetratricopeptide repeat protein, partial [Steroidobacteraceae bacterium]